MRPAIEVATQICGCADARQRKSDIALIEADRAELVAEIVAELRDQSEEKQDHAWMGPLDIADYIEAKFGGSDAVMVDRYIDERKQSIAKGARRSTARFCLSGEKKVAKDAEEIEREVKGHFDDIRARRSFK